MASKLQKKIAKALVKVSKTKVGKVLTKVGEKVIKVSPGAGKVAEKVVTKATGIKVPSGTSGKTPSSSGTTSGGSGRTSGGTSSGSSGGKTKSGGKNVVRDVVRDVVTGAVKVVTPKRPGITPPQQTTTVTPVQPQVVDVAKIEVDKRRQREAEYAGRAMETYSPGESKEFTVSGSGTSVVVTVGGKTYSGQETIPELGGKRAVEFVAQQQRAARSQGVTGDFTVTMTRPTAEEERIWREEQLAKFKEQENKIREEQERIKSYNITFQNELGSGSVYDSLTGSYVQPTTYGTKVTTRPLNFLETEYIKEKDIQSSAALSVPFQYMGTIFSKTLSKELVDKSTEGGFGQRFITYIDPKFQYDVAYYNEQLRADKKEVESMAKRINTSYQNLISSGLTEEQLQSGNLIQENLSQRQIDELNRYNLYVDSLQQSGSYQRMKANQGTFLQRIAKTPNLTERQKLLAAGSVRVATTLPYLFPGTRVIVGTGQVIEGAKTYSYAESNKEKLIGAAQIGFGGLVAYTGLKGLSPKGIATISPSSSFSGTTIKTGIYGVSTGVIGGVSYLDYKLTLKSTGSKSVALGAALGTGGTLLAGLYGPAAYTKLKDVYSTRGDVKLKTASIGDKPFIRSTRGKIRQEVFYDRAKSFNILKPSTWKYAGYKPGQFYTRRYRIVDPLVESKFMGKTGNIKYYTVSGNKVVQRVGSPKTFPIDSPKNQYSWFTSGKGVKSSVQQYYVPKKFMPKEIVSSSKAMGYSASPVKWVEGGKYKFLEKYQTYYSGKGVSVFFLRTGTNEGSKIIIGGKSESMGLSPRVYQGYFKEAIPLKATREIKVVNPFDPRGKPWKQYELPIKTKPGKLYEVIPKFGKQDLFIVKTEPGKLYLPLYKQEVEGVVTGTRVSVPSGYYFNFGGRRIPIQSGTYLTGTESNLGVKDLALLKSISSTTGKPLSISSSQPYSYIPSTTGIPAVSVPIIYSPTYSTPDYDIYKLSTSSTVGLTSTISSPSISSIPSPPPPSPSIITPIPPPIEIITPPPEPIPSIISPPPNVISYLNLEEPKKKKKKKEEEEDFEVFVKRFGKDIKIGKFKTLPSAKTSLTSKLRTTLSASGFIQKQGKKLRVSELGLVGPEFRVSKQEPYRLVEKKERRLKIGTAEIPEILTIRGGTSRPRVVRPRKNKSSNIFGIKSKSRSRNLFGI